MNSSTYMKYLNTGSFYRITLRLSMNVCFLIQDYCKNIVVQVIYYYPTFAID